MDEKKDRSPEELLHESLENVKKNSQEINSIARELIKKNQMTFDIANGTLLLLESCSGYVNFETQISLWQDVNNNLSNFGKIINESSNYINISGSAATSAYTDNVIGFKYRRSDALNFEDSKNTNVLCDYIELLSQPSVKEEAIALLRSWGFDKPRRKGNKSPLELLQTAYAAFEQPIIENNPVSTSLLPIRGCINEIINYFLDKRPVNEPASNNYSKIISIGKQLSYDGLTIELIELWANQWSNQIKKEDGLVDLLSVAKNVEMARGEWKRRLNLATSFLISLLQGLDPNKLKKPNSRSMMQPG